MQVDLALVRLGGDGVELLAQVRRDVLVGLGVEQLGEVARVASATVERLPRLEL